MNIDSLAKNWWTLTLRGGAVIIFGVLTFVVPGVTLAALILLFGGYAPVGLGMLLTGLAGMLAGACSMALGEWVSQTSSRKLEEREIRIESSALAEDPEGEELKLIYEAKGLHDPRYAAHADENGIAWRFDGVAKRH